MWPDAKLKIPGLNCRNGFCKSFINQGYLAGIEVPFRCDSGAILVLNCTIYVAIFGYLSPANQPPPLSPQAAPGKDVKAKEQAQEKDKARPTPKPLRRQAVGICYRGIRVA